MFLDCAIFYIFYATCCTTDGDVKTAKTYLGILDYSWLFSYAIAMYFRYAIIMCCYCMFMRTYVSSVSAVGSCQTG